MELFYRGRKEIRAMVGSFSTSAPQKSRKRSEIQSVSLRAQTSAAWCSEPSASHGRSRGARPLPRSPMIRKAPYVTPLGARISEALQCAPARAGKLSSSRRLTRCRELGGKSGAARHGAAVRCRGAVRVHSRVSCGESSSTWDGGCPSPASAPHRCVAPSGILAI